MTAVLAPAPPAAVVIFGASGDLARRKLLPALRALAEDGLLDPGTVIVGVGRSDLGDHGWQRALADAGPGERWAEVCRNAEWVTGDYAAPETYDHLRSLLVELDDKGASGNRLFYLSVPPGLFPTIVGGLGSATLQEAPGEFARVVIEKPFGTDLDSGRALDEALHAVLDERQIFRIDHYLGKETVQNVLALRFANLIFEPVWNRRYVDSVQLTIAEELGVGGRAGFYDAAGALRDIVQNHALQVLALVAMEPPATMSAEAIRSEKVKLLTSIDPLDATEVARDVVRGQYRGYRDEDDVAPDSTTETFVALRLRIDNWRWAGVPFHLRTGKRLPKRVTEIALQFREVPHLPFAAAQVERLEPNSLVLRIQPDEGISLSFGAKVPGTAFDIRSVDMDMTWCEEFDTDGPEAYERLLHDALIGDPTLFIRSDEVDQAWQVVQPVLDAWQADGADGPSTYEAGTWGPVAADELVQRDGTAWRTP